MDVIADLALVFNWTPETIDRLSIGELLDFHKRAVDRAKFIGNRLI